MEDVRVYGDIHGLSEQAFEEVRGGLPFTKVVYKDRVLSVDYEGVYIDIEGFLQDMARLMDKDGQGKVDFIDHVDWKLIRYVLENGGYKGREVKLNNVMEPLNQEIGA
ncbi:MAG: hypothetical protein JW718_03980 [Desulfovibrionaceae bacterium]|nr:hypothetical protein [Desulfovibrionaceae bacterium]